MKRLRKLQINSFLNSYYDVSAFGVYFSTNLNQYDKVIDIVFREFKKLKEKRISDRELKKVKEYLRGGMLINLENTTNRMMRMANSILYYNKIITIDEYLKKIDNINADDLLRVANDTLDESKLIKVILKY